MALVLDGSLGVTFPVTAGSASAVQASSGRVLQVVQTTYSTSISTTSTSFVSTGITASITPSSASNKVLCIVDVNGVGKSGGNGNIDLQLVRGSTVISSFEGIAGNTSTTATNYIGNCGITYLDSPSTTSSTTYTVKYAADFAGTAYINGAASSASMSQITLMEIAA